MRWKRGNRLKLVVEADAPASTRLIFDEVRHALGVPAVPILYQAYAAYPNFLALHWQAFRAAVASSQFFLLGNRLAAEAYTRAHNYFEVSDLRDPPASAPVVPTPLAPSLAEILDYYQYLDPLQLLVAAAQLQAFEGPVGEPAPPGEPVLHPVFTSAPTLLADDAASPAIQRIWDERRRLVEQTEVPDEHRALAALRVFYQAYWRAQRQLAQSPLYNDCQYRTGETGWALARELPGPIEASIPQLLDAGLGEEELSSLARINEALLHSLAGLIFDVVLARIGCEGGTPRAPQQASSESVTVPQTAGSPHRAA